MKKNLDWALRAAEKCAAQAEQNTLWREFYRRTLPPGRERRRKLWLLSFHARKNADRAYFWRRVAEAGSYK